MMITVKKSMLAILMLMITLSPICHHVAKWDGNGMKTILIIWLVLLIGEYLCFWWRGTSLHMHTHTEREREREREREVTDILSYYRRRQNPLYDAILREDSKVSSKSTGHGLSRCLCLSIVLLTILSFLALILACVAVTGITTSKPGKLALYVCWSRWYDISVTSLKQIICFVKL